MGLLKGPEGLVQDYLRVSVTDRCNLRCVYCMPPDGIDRAPREEILTFEELTRLIRIATERGVSKVRVTGGEPFSRRDLPVFFKKLSELEGLETLGVTTNGLLLEQHLEQLRETRLGRINFSLDSLEPERYKKITRGGDLEQVLAALAAALEAGFEVKVNVVAMSDLEPEELDRYVEFAAEEEIPVRFIEFMPLCGGGWSRERFYPLSSLRETILDRHDLEAGPAGDLQFSSSEGEIGFIGFLSDPFCESCSRLRLSSQGTLYTCLFSADGPDLREPLRNGASDAELGEIFGEAAASKCSENPAAKDKSGSFSVESTDEFGFIRKKGG